MARNSALSSIQIAEAEKKVSTRYSAECTGLRAVITSSDATTMTDAKAMEQQGLGIHGQRYLASAARLAAISCS